MQKGIDYTLLEKMYKAVSKIDVIYQPSDFWVELNHIHKAHLGKSGFSYFKRSISGKYFSWGTLGIIRHQLWPIVCGLTKGNLSPLFQTEFKNYKQNLGRGVRRFNPFTALVYKIYVGYLFDFVQEIDCERLLDKIEEPEMGHPFVINYRGKKISQDLCNSVYEYYSITQSVSLKRNINIAELGAGYGRLAMIFLKAFPKSTYTIIDIPPALFVSQTYLKHIFKDEKIFTYREFSSFSKVKTEFNGCRIRFLMSHQIELLPKKYFTLFITISTLHEMRREQIRNYLNQVDRLCKNVFYIKQWRKARTKDNNYIREPEYPYSKKWNIIARRGRHQIQNMFFDTLFKIPSN